MRPASFAALCVGVAGLAGLVLVALTLVPYVAADRQDLPVGIGPGRQEVREPPGFDVVLRLRAELAAAAADNTDYPVDPAQAALVATAPQGYVPLGRITSAAIGLDAVYGAGVHPEVLKRGPGHWPGSATPGQPGNTVLSGHRTTHTRSFGELDALTTGDPIVVTSGEAAPVTYRVTQTAVVAEAEYLDVVLARPADPTARQLTLFACHPEGDRTHRIVVRASATTGDGG